MRAAVTRMNIYSGTINIKYAMGVRAVATRRAVNWTINVPARTCIRRRLASLDMRRTGHNANRSSTQRGCPAMPAEISEG